MPINNELHRNDDVNFNVDFFQIFFEDDSGELKTLRPFQSTDGKARDFFALVKNKYLNCKIQKCTNFYIANDLHERQDFLNSMLSINEMANVVQAA